METINNFFSPQLIWFLIGLVLAILEFFIPGVIVIFFGFGAWVTALLVWIFDFGLNTQLVIFLVSSLVLLLVLRRKMKSIFVGQSEDDALDDLDELIGKKVKVTEAINTNESGTVLLNGTSWKAEAEEAIAIDEIVEITEKNNLTLKVKPITKE